jgi:hypothetical protein
MSDAANTKSEVRTGKHRPGYRAPRTGEPRRQRKRLLLDRLPETVKDEIVAMHEAGATWKEIARAISPKAGQPVPTTSLHRWHSLRVEHGSQVPLLRKIVALLEKLVEARP